MLSPPTLSAVAMFRPRPLDQQHAATVANALVAQGQRPTQTAVMRRALKDAAEAITAGHVRPVDARAAIAALPR